MNDDQLKIFAPPDTQSPRSPGARGTIRSKIDSWMNASVTHDRVREIDAETDLIEARERQMEAQISAAATRLKGEAMLYRLAVDRDLAEKDWTFSKMLDSNLLSHDEKLLLMERKKELLSMEGEVAAMSMQLQAVRRGQAPALPPRRPEPRSLPGRSFDRSYNPGELDSIAMKIWAEVRTVPPPARPERLAEFRTELAEKLPPYDVATVMRQAEEMLRTVK